MRRFSVSNRSVAILGLALSAAVLEATPIHAQFGGPGFQGGGGPGGFIGGPGGGPGGQQGGGLTGGFNRGGSGSGTGFPGSGGGSPLGGFSAFGMAGLGSAGRGDGGIGGAAGQRAAGGQGDREGRFSSPFALGPREAVELTAACTDLFLDAPNATTRMTGGAGSEVLLPSGQVVGLDEALSSGVLTLSGTGRVTTLLGSGSPLLKLRLINASPQRVAVRLLPGSHVIPQGQSSDRLSREAKAIFELAREERTPERVLQQAIWAARGSTLEDVEQTQIASVKPDEASKVQELLEDAGLKLQFDRARGEYERRFEDAQDQLEAAGGVQPLRGSAFLPDGSKVAVEGHRKGDLGVVTLRPLRRSGVFHYRAEIADRKDGRVSVKLIHLKTGHPLPSQKSLLVYPAG